MRVQFSTGLRNSDTHQKVVHQGFSDTSYAACHLYSDHVASATFPQIQNSVPVSNPFSQLNSSTSHSLFLFFWHPHLLLRVPTPVLLNPPETLLVSLLFPLKNEDLIHLLISYTSFVSCRLSRNYSYGYTIHPGYILNASSCDC